MVQALRDRAVTGDLAASYRYCRLLHRRHGRTYYLATRLLPAAKRPYVHALYGFARYADEIVDRTDDLPPCARACRLATWSDRFLAGLDGAPVADPVLPAVLDTIHAYQLDRADFAAFLASMAMDTTVAEYADYPALLSYMEGSAAAIGLMMLPILDPVDPVAAREPARQLGFAFQLTNFIRDVAEDLDRGRVYLPQADLARFGLDWADLAAAAAHGEATAPIRALIAFEVGRARDHYAAAAPGLDLLAPGSQPCIRAAYHVYQGILDEVERAGHDVFRRRAVVPPARRLRLLARALRERRSVPANDPWGHAGPASAVQG